MKLNRTLRSLVLGVPLTFGLIGCIPAPPATGVGPGATTTSEWKEGYGGDSIALEVKDIIETTCFQSRKLRPYLIRRALETEKDIADSICNLLNTGELIIESVDQPMVNGVAKDAANYPDARPRRMQIKKEWWKSPDTTAEKKEQVVLHELSPLIGLGDKDYVRSSRLQSALASLRGQTTAEISCERSRLLALFAGAQNFHGRWLSLELGMLKCKSAMEVFFDTAKNETFETAMQLDIVHAYLLGLLMGVTRTTDARQIKEFETIFIESLVRLPDSLANWSPAMCQLASEEPSTARECGNIVELLFGATMRQRIFFGGAEDARPIDFTRASYGLIIKIAESTEKSLADVLVVRGNVDPLLAEAAIRSQSWPHLAFLGNLQRSFQPGQKASIKMLSTINWRNVIKAAHLNARVDFREPAITSCVPDGLRQQATAIIDGESLANECDGNIAI